MYCENCGKKIEKDSKFCTGCGCKVEIDKVVEVKKIDNVQNKDNGLRIASIILGVLSIVCCITVIFFSYGFFLSIIGFILGLFALKKGKNTLGIVLNVVGFILSIVMCVLFILFIVFAIEEENSYYDDYDYNYDYYDDYDYGFDFDSFKDIIDIY